MDEQDKQNEVVEDSTENTYIYVDQYGVVETTNQKYFIKD
jgi:hypothetical protein